MPYSFIRAKISLTYRKVYDTLLLFNIIKVQSRKTQIAYFVFTAKYHCGKYCKYSNPVESGTSLLSHKYLINFCGLPVVLSKMAILSSFHFPEISTTHFQLL